MGTPTNTDPGANGADAANSSDPWVGLRFPSVGGTALSGEYVRFPDDLAGAPAVLIVAYQRMAQGDVWRWFEFLESREPDLKVYEVPTIPATDFRPLASWLDNGMRKGLPRALWPRVVTLYEDGAAVREFLGDSGFVGASVVLLDSGGVVRWFHAHGFTPDKGRSLLDELRRVVGPPPDR
ncbi:MAG: hypothetical protein ACXVP1_05780 [Thermoleophilia bacterium]